MAYLPNPGRLWELLLPGSILYLVRNRLTPERNTEYTVVAVERFGVPVLLHTHLSNVVVQWLIEQNRIPGLENASVMKSEVAMGKSRFDFLLQKDGREIVLEVKLCTLFNKQIAMFPDAVTHRGRKHMEGLAEISRQGVEGCVVFLVHSFLPKYFIPEYHTDLDFSRTLLELKDKISIKPVAIGWKKDLTLKSEVSVLDIPWRLIRNEAHDSGSYIIILELKRPLKLKIGSLGKVQLRKGFYLYVGSAKTNLTARVERHKRRRKKLFWHIDYLREHADFCTSLPVRARVPRECEIAGALGDIAEWIVSGFGSSDCLCETHLFGMADSPVNSPAFINMLLHFRIDRLYSELT